MSYLQRFLTRAACPQGASARSALTLRADRGARQASGGWRLQVLINIPSCTGRPQVSTGLRSGGSDRGTQPAEGRWRRRSAAGARPGLRRL